MERSLENKLGFTCKEWNTEEGCKYVSKNGEACPNKHACSKVTRDNQMCWGRHRIFEHKDN